jgi:hypothetical protein
MHLLSRWMTRRHRLQALRFGGNIMINPVSGLRSRFILTLVSVLLSFSAWAQNPAPPLPPPGSASMIDTANVPQGTFALYKCQNKGDVILCLCVLTRTAPGSVDFTVNNLAGPRLIDDLHQEHRLLRAYFINGRGEHQQTVNVTRDDSVWFGLEFENRPGDLITAARILFARLNNLELHAPIEQSRGVIGGKP